MTSERQGVRSAAGHAPAAPDAHELTLLVATDRRPLIGCAVAVRSLLDHATRLRGARIVVLCHELTSHDQDRLRKSWSAAGFPVTTEFVEVPAEWTAHLIRGKALSRMAYARLFLGTVLGPEVERLVYIDTDIVFGLDISELLRIDLRGRTVAAVPNGNEDGDEDREVARLGMRGPRFFNSGVLLIDVTRWRELDVGRRVIEFCAQNPELLKALDQDGMNVVLDGDWEPLPERWNRWAVRAAENEHCVLHFTMTPKPWDVDYRGAHRARFFAAVDRTAFTGWRPANPLGLAAPLKRLSRRLPYLPTAMRALKRALGLGRQQRSG